MLTALLVSACSQTSDAPALSPDADSNASQPALPTGASPPAPVAAASGGQPAFDAIRADETIRFTGTEPFWGGTIRAGEMRYSTPENEKGEAIAVRRFAGNSGLGFNGTLDGAPVDMAVTLGACSDGMSDRTYPFTVTLQIGTEQRRGCAWTDRTPFSGEQNP